MFGQTHSTVQDTTIRTTPAEAIALVAVHTTIDILAWLSVLVIQNPHVLPPDLHGRPRPMASLSPITATPDLTEQVYQRLLYAICDGKLAPNTRLTQEDLAATLG